uniref:Uncharacterized protein n=1 Tax=Romanomermis culicivorax TaxID=13658 RepID=A0A915KJ77_ROMCU
MPPSHHSDGHHSRHESHHHDDRHCKATDHSPRQDAPTRDSRQQDRCTDAPPHPIQSEQTRQVHSTGFYERDYQRAFRHSPPKLTDYISPLHQDAQIQQGLEALKQLLQQPFKVLLPPAPPMDVKPAMPIPATPTMTTMLLPPTASMSAPSTTMLLISSSTSTATSTIPSQPKLVITTRPVLGTILPAGTALQSTLQLPSKTTELPNYVRFCTTDPPHSITLATPHYPPHIDSSVDSFSLHNLHEMVLINFFGCIGVCITMAVHVRATNAFLAIYQYFRDHYHMDFSKL